jgi:hypothetical protein
MCRGTGGHHHLSTQTKPSTAIPLPGELGHMFQVHYGSQVFQSIHDLSHPGTRPTTKLVTERFVWPGMKKDCCIWALACQPCQCFKVSCHTAANLNRDSLGN